MKKFKKTIWIVLAVIVIIIVVLPLFFDREDETINATIRAEAPGEFIELPQGVTQYQETGPDSAQTVLLVAGLGVPYHILDPTFEMLKKHGFHVIRYNHFGRGYSDRPDGKYNQQFFTKQIADLLEALEIDKAINIVGLSMGAPVSAEFTINYPEKVNKVVLISPMHEAEKIYVLKTPHIGEYIMHVFFGPSLVKKASDDFYKQEAFKDWPAKYNTQMKYKGFKKAILATLRNYMTEDKLPVYKKLNELNKPVFMIWGKEDKTFPYDGNERVRAVLDCEFLGVDDAGHLPHCVEAEFVNQRIIDFLEK